MNPERTPDPGHVAGRHVAAERRHQPAGTGWAEWHRLAAIDRAGGLAVAAEIGIHRTGQGGGVRDVGTFHCVVLRAGHDPLVIAELDIVPPETLWEFRTSGLWVEAVCETANRHWSYGLEAFGLEIDDPDEMLGRGYGDRQPIGWELEFESDEEPMHDPVDTAEQAGSGQPSTGGYGQDGTADGELLFGDGTRPLSGPATRRHRWGGAGPGRSGPVDDRVVIPAGMSIAPVTVKLPSVHGGIWQLRAGDGELTVTGR